MIIEKLNMIHTIYQSDTSEYIISDYFLKNTDEILNARFNAILKEIGVSKSTLNRFFQSLGYKNFTEVQYQLYFERTSHVKYRNKYHEDELHDMLTALLRNKKRIIVLGDENSLSPLLIYKQLFIYIGIDLEIKLKFSKTLELLESYCLQKNDLVIYVSLFNTNLDLQLNVFGDYIMIMDFLKKRNIPCLYVGLTAGNNDNEIFYKSINRKTSIAQRIYELCKIFENIYSIVETNN